MKQGPAHTRMETKMDRDLFQDSPDDFCLAICDETIMKSFSIAEIQVVQTVQVKNLSLVIPGRMENV